MKDFLTNENPLLGDEEVVGVVVPHTPLTEDDFKLFNIGKRKLCANCTKGFHNQYQDDLVCKKNGCKCKCQGYYLGKDGETFIAWGKLDASKICVDDGFYITNPNPVLDNFIRRVNHEHSKLKDLGIIYSRKICTRCGIKGRFEGWACKPCKIELSEKDQTIVIE